MSADPGPHDIDATAAVLCPDGAAMTRSVGPGLYESLDADFDGFRGHVLVSQHRFAEAWPGWEMHPKGDETVMLIEGAAEFVLWIGGREAVVQVDRPGQYVIVPKGTWHTARPLRPTTMLFLTPGEGTEHAETPR